MRAVVLTEDRPALAVATLPDPEPAAGEVLLEVAGCGICGSDLHVASRVAPAGMVLGHEIVGTVAALGPGVDASAWTTGTLVAARPFAGCGGCEQCRRGRADHCAAVQLLGLGRPGGFAELVAVQADELFRLPPGVAGLGAAEQALVEPLAVARRAVRRAGLVPGDRVAILGAGPIGLAVLAWVRALGVDHVLVSDPAPGRRELALGLGATAAVDPTAHPLADAARAALGPAGPSVVFECTGRRGLVQEAMALAAIEGRVVVVGVCLGEDATVPYTGLSKELDVRYAIYYGREDFTDTIDALDARRLDAAGLVTETVGLDALPERFARLLAEADGGKVVLQP